MADNIILVERDGPVALVTLNRPDALNALSRALRSEIVRVFTELKVDPDIRAVVLTGSGRAFTTRRSGCRRHSTSSICAISCRPRAT